MRVSAVGGISGFLLGGLVSLLTGAADAASRNPDCAPIFDYSKDKVVSNVVSPDGVTTRAEVDITPEPLATSSFEEAVLQACGEFGSKVNPRNVKKLADSLSPDLVKMLAREFPSMNDSQIRAQIASIWTSEGGFEHVFCGQEKGTRIGGLHFAGRYQQLQQKGQLCRLEDNLDFEEVLPQTVYTIGVTMPDGTVDRKKGFSIRQSAEDIFFEAARTYLRNCQKPARQRRVCVTRFYKDGSFESLFVCAPGNGLVTYYPLAANTKNVEDCD